MSISTARRRARPPGRWAGREAERRSFRITR